MWIALAAVLVVVAGVLVGGFVGYRYHAIAQFVSAVEEDDVDLVSKWGTRLDEIGALDAGIREVFSAPNRGYRISWGEQLRRRAGLLRTLGRLLDEHEPLVVRRNAAAALVMYAGQTDDVAALTVIEHHAAHASDPYVRSKMLQAYGDARPDTPAPAFVIDALQSPDPIVKLRAASALEQLEPSRTEEVVGALLELFDSSDPAIALQAFRSLPVDFSPPLLEVEEVLEPLRRLVGDPDPKVADSAITAIGKLGGDARAAVPDLVARLGEPALRAVAAASLLKIDREAAIAAGVDPAPFAGE